MPGHSVLPGQLGLFVPHGWSVVLGFVVLVAAVGFASWCSWTAGRLDRMHLRVESARSSLERQLQHRAAVAIELAIGGFADPASAVLVLSVARAAREGSGDDGAQWLAESELTAVLLAVDLPRAPDEPLVEELVAAGRRAALARRIYNDVATRTASLHRRRRVRWFHLAGHAALPRPVDFDDRSDFGLS